jgi:Tol biopolymer transport system component
VWSVDRDGRNEVELTPGSAQTFCPSISPDGTRIAAPVWGSLNRFVTVMQPDGSGIVTPDGPIWDWSPAVWSPDGRTLAMNGRSIDGQENPRAFLDPNGTEPARPFFADNAFIVDWQRLAP